jgi:hypothetical protein
MRQAGIRPVCGIFKRSQLSEKFATYAAATTMCTPDQERALPKADRTEVASENEPPPPVIGEIIPEPTEVETIEFITAGIVAVPSVSDTTALDDHSGFQEKR